MMRRLTRKQHKSIATRRANADTRARAFLERWMGGETHQQIADSLGIAKATVTCAITQYRKRHPDTPIPAGNIHGDKR